MPLDKLWLAFVGFLDFNEEKTTKLEYYAMPTNERVCLGIQPIHFQFQLIESLQTRGCKTHADSCFPNKINFCYHFSLNQ